MSHIAGFSITYYTSIKQLSVGKLSGNGGHYEELLRYLLIISLVIIKASTWSRLSRKKIRHVWYSDLNIQSI